MPENLQLNHPWLVAIWPGMGSVALNAGIYLLSKLNMTVISEFEVNELFDVEQVEVKEGVIQKCRRIHNRFFLWKDPHQKHDLVLFLGEAQPPLGRYTFCRQLLDYAQSLGVERIFTFAAMATQMHPNNPSLVYGAATTNDSLEELKRLELVLLQEGNIGGLNGVLLGVAAERGLWGACLLGEMPHVFHQLPFPKASLAILEAFTTLARIDLDFTELAEQSKAMEEQLGAVLERVQQAMGQQQPGEMPGEAMEEEQEAIEPEIPKAQPDPMIEELFEKANKDRSKAFELKQELDRLGIFKDYEDRFLDLFKKPE